MKPIYLDIETVPGHAQWIHDYIKSNVSPPGNIKKQESIDKWWDEKSETAIQEAHQKCALDGAMNQIVCIGCASENEEVKTFTGLEEKILKDFFQWIDNMGFSATTYVGHNIAGFDLEVIKKRAIILGVPVPNMFRQALRAKPWDGIIYDTMLKWDAKKMASLDKICKALRITEFDTEISGEHVAALYRDNNLIAIADYCKTDVEKTRAIYNRMKDVI